MQHNQIATDLVQIGSVLAVLFTVGAAVWLHRTAEGLRYERETLAHDVNLLQMALLDASDTFHRYAEIHYAKETPEGDKKAHDNNAKADAIDKILISTGFDRAELNPIQRAFRESARLSREHRSERAGRFINRG